MGLVTHQEIIARFPALATHSIAVVNSDFLYYAEVEVNGRLSANFATPLDGHPTVKDLIMDVAYYRSLRFKDKDRADAIKKVFDARFKAINAGDEYIFTGSGTLEPTGGGSTIWSNVMDYHPTHSMLDAEVSHVDSDRVADLESIRNL